MRVEETLARADVAAVAADERGIITAVNARFTEVFGWTSREAVGKPLTLIIPPELRDSHHMGFSRFITTGSSTLLGRPLTLPAVGKDGRVFRAEHRIVAERGGAGWLFAAAIRPLAEGAPPP